MQWMERQETEYRRRAAASLVTDDEDNADKCREDESEDGSGSGEIKKPTGLALSAS